MSGHTHSCDLRPSGSLEITFIIFSIVDEARGLKSIQDPIPASQIAYGTLWAPSIAGYGGERQSAHITVSISVLSKAVMVQSYY